MDITEVLSEVARTGYFLRPCPLDRPHEESLLRLIAGLGVPSGNAELNIPGFKHGCVDIVSPVSGIKKYSDGREIRSTTSQSMQCHTDGSTDVDPIDILVMFLSFGDDRVKSIIVHVDDVISQLNRNQLEILSRRIYPFSDQLFPILTLDCDLYKIRYDRFEIDRAIGLGKVTLDQEAIAALQALDEAIEGASKHVSVNEHDIIIMDNHRMMHGRTSIPNDSQRLLMRVRLRK